MAFCSNCGNKLKSTYKFCPKCGKKIYEEEVTLYEKVKNFVIENNKVSVALIQKEFKISASSATKIIKELETNGIVSPSNGRKGRVVLVNESEDEVCKHGFIDKTIKYITKIVNTKDSTSKFDRNDIESNIFLAMLSYIGIFALVPYFLHNDSKYVKYHAVRGINLLIVEVVYVLLDRMLSMIKVSKVVVDYGSLVGTKMVTPPFISIPMGIVGGILTGISIIGIVNVCNGKARELPLMDKIKIIK